MKKYLLLALLFLAINTTKTLLAQSAQGSYHHPFTGMKPPINPSSPYSPLSTGQSGTGANIDVLYHKCFWRINPDSSVKYIRGYVQTNFKTITSPVTAISFDLNAVMTVDSVRFRGAKLAAGNITRSGNILNIALGTSLALNVTDSIWVYYRGTPPNVVGQAEGYQSNVSKGVAAPAGGSYIYTLSESYEDRDWWPCKADMKDKIDSMDIVVSVPWGTPTAADTFWVAANGKLVDSTIGGTSRQFTFKNRYPTASYLVAIGVARYRRYYRTPVNINGTNVPVVYNVWNGKTAATYTAILKTLDSGSVLMSKYSTKYGDYPFKNEKHGYYEFGWGGGMEHQTFSAMSAGSMQSWDVTAHELMHQWFGDKVTFATWNDLWLAEGFAKYGEALALELMPGLSGTATDSSWRRTIKNSALTFTGANSQSVYIPNSSMGTSDQIWASNYGTTVYDRGAMVVSMLRALAGDAIYFQACKNYLNNSAYGSATTDSLKNNFNALLGVDLTPFFNDFVYGDGNPIYNNTISWNNYATNKLIIQVGAQTKSTSSSVAYFRAPIVLRVQGAAGKDTTIVIWDMNGSLARAGNGISAPVPGNILTYNLSFNPTSVKFDNKHQTMVTGGTVNVTTLDLKILDFNAKNSGDYNEAFVTLDDNSINSDVIIEKSHDGLSFTDLGKMTLTSTGTPKRYYFKDAAPFNGANYYRVKFKDLSGEFTYSKVVKVVTGRAASFTIQNNPAKGTLNIKAVLNSAAYYNFSIIDASGKTLTTEGRNVTGTTQQFDIRKLVPGAYILKISNNNESNESLRFVVQ